MDGPSGSCFFSRACWRPRSSGWPRRLDAMFEMFGCLHGVCHFLRNPSKWILFPYGFPSTSQKGVPSRKGRLNWQPFGDESLMELPSISNPGNQEVLCTQSGPVLSKSRLIELSVGSSWQPNSRAGCQGQSTWNSFKSGYGSKLNYQVTTGF